MDDFRVWLEAQGFTIAANHLAPAGNVVDWYAHRRTTIPAAECENNEGKHAQLVVWPHAYRYADRLNCSVEVDVSGCADGVWFQLRAYAMEPDEFKARVETIERALVAAWNAIPRPQKVEQ